MNRFFINYNEERHMVSIQSGNGTGIHLTPINNVGPGMATLLTELVIQANEAVRLTEELTKRGLEPEFVTNTTKDSAKWAQVELEASSAEQSHD